MMLLRAAALALAAVVALPGCERGTPTAAAPPPPADVHADATGHYCGMLLVDHEGPKGQVHLASRAQPVWFSSARDTIAFLRLPDEPKDVVAVWVSDMARAQRWEQPEPGLWVDAREAWFVVDSDRRGGMGAPEAVPFSDRTAAEAFRAQHRGRIVRLADIADAYVLGPADGAAVAPGATQAQPAGAGAGGAHGHAATPPAAASSNRR
jgi:copper chaperone NosL